MASKDSSTSQDEIWTLRLYIAGQTPNSVVALANLKSFCDEYLADNYQIEVIDVVNNAQLAREDQIIAIPTLVRRQPLPPRKVIGNLSDRNRMLVGLDLPSYLQK